MSKELNNSNPELPPLEDPPLPDSYEPIPGEVPEVPENPLGED